MDYSVIVTAAVTVLATVLAYELPKLAKKTKNTVDDAVVEKAVDFIENADTRAKVVAAVLKLLGK